MTDGRVGGIMFAHRDSTYRTSASFAPSTPERRSAVSVGSGASGARAHFVRHVCAPTRLPRSSVSYMTSDHFFLFLRFALAKWSRTMVAKAQQPSNEAGNQLITALKTMQ